MLLKGKVRMKEKLGRSIRRWVKQGTYVVVFVSLVCLVTPNAVVARNYRIRVLGNLTLLKFWMYQVITAQLKL